MLDKGIFRVQEEGGKNLLETKSAKYSIVPKKHGSLGLNLYTHATSPIRRYVDLLVQRVLLFGKVDINIDLVNTIESNVKRFNKSYLYLWKLADKSNISGVILKILGSNKYVIYIEEWQKILNIRLLDKDLVVDQRVKLEYYVNSNSFRPEKKLIFNVIN
jgi:hypothetical protein